MAFAATSPAACAVSETSSARAFRLVVSSVLIVIALLECGISGLLYSGLHSLSSLVFLLITAVFLATAVMSVRGRSSRTLIVVQSAAAAALLALFWMSGNQAHGGPSITVGHSTYEMTLTLAGLLFIALLLARLLRRSPAEQACKCG